MRKILLLLLAFVSLTLTLKAQTQSLEDLKLQLEQTDTLYEAEKYDEVLEICLSIGRSTERCDSEQERTVYVRSQILACRCYDQLERYQEGYELSKRLMATQLTDEEKKELSDAYVNSAYFLAVPMMKGKNTDYGKVAKTEHSHPLGMVVSTHFRCGKGVKRGLKNGALPFTID